MKGGYQIIDITALDLEIKAKQTAISNSRILKQLDALKTYIENGYDFSKPLNNQLKPILLRFRDKKANEKQEASVWANLSKKDDNLTFVVEAVVNSTNLSTIQIEVVFELKQDEAGNNYYGIKTAKYLLSGGVSGGTKLYKHNLDIQAVNETEEKTYNFNIQIISKNSNKYEEYFSSQDTELISIVSCYAYAELPNDSFENDAIMFNCECDITDAFKLNLILDNGDTKNVNLEVADFPDTFRISDTVTEL